MCVLTDREEVYIVMQCRSHPDSIVLKGGPKWAYCVQQSNTQMTDLDFFLLLLSPFHDISEEVILNEDRTTEDERRYIMEARKRAMQKRKKLRTLGKSRSTESEDEEEEEEGTYCYKSILLNAGRPFLGVTLEEKPLKNDALVSTYYNSFGRYTTTAVSL